MHGMAVSKVWQINFLLVELLCKISQVVLAAVVDLASMRDAVKALNGDPSLINPQCQTDLVIDHSVVDHYGSADSKSKLFKLEYKRNIEI